jgi:hypothetical protein
MYRGKSVSIRNWQATMVYKGMEVCLHPVILTQALDLRMSRSVSGMVPLLQGRES